MGLIHWMLWTMRLAATESLRPRDLRPLISKAAAEAQGQRQTQEATRRLRRYIKEHPSLYGKFSVRPSTELHLRRFSDGGVHCLPPQPDDFQGRGGGMCAVL